MDVELLTIGTELLLGFTVDTNAAEIGQLLADRGIRITRHTTVDDHPERISECVREACDRTRVVLVTGGLGPTRDDLTREVIGPLLGMPLRFDQGIWDMLAVRYRALGRELPESNRPQALVPTGATVLPNPRGTAPGLWLEHADGVVILLPGVPIEMRYLMQHEVLPRLAAMTDEGAPVVIRSLTLRTAGVSEAALAGHLAGMEEAVAPLSLAYLPHTSGVDLRLTAWQLGAVDADALLIRAANLLQQRVGTWCYGEGHDDLAGQLLELLRSRGMHLAVAESCTGGMLGSRLTAIPGSSAVFLGGVISYADQAKESLLDVSSETLEQAGAVSAESALAMVNGVANRLGAEVAVSITGIAGPEGGSPEKPVGTVYFGFMVGGVADTVRLAFPGTRDEIRQRAVAAALLGLRNRLLQS